MGFITAHISRRTVQIVLGCLWLLDGGLQLQHQMFTSNFATQVIQPVAEGQPRFVSGLIHFATSILLTHPALFNGFFATIQLALGFFILWKRTVAWGLIASVLWALVVWVVGEGYGGIFGLHVVLLTGAPGAALLYALLALAVLPLRHAEVASEEVRPVPAYWLVFVWLVLWVGGAIYQLLPGQNSVSSITSVILGNASSAPDWLASIDTHVANAITSIAASMVGTHSYWFVLVLAALMVGIGIGVLSSGVVRIVAILFGILLSLLFWVVGQSLGGYYTGLATDPNAGPLFVLLGVAILGRPALDRKLSSFGAREKPSQ